MKKGFKKTSTFGNVGAIRSTNKNKLLKKIIIIICVSNLHIKYQTGFWIVIVALRWSLAISVFFLYLYLYYLPFTPLIFKSHHFNYHVAELSKGTHLWFSNPTLTMFTLLFIWCFFHWRLGLWLGEPWSISSSMGEHCSFQHQKPPKCQINFNQDVLLDLQLNDWGQQSLVFWFLFTAAIIPGRHCRENARKKNFFF